MHDYDLIVIGAGMVGVSAASKASAQGWRVANADRLPYGGTCALRGCDPKRILRRGAEIIDAARLLRGKGIRDEGPTIDWQALMAHKRGFTDPVCASAAVGEIFVVRGPGADHRLHASPHEPEPSDAEDELVCAEHEWLAWSGRPRSTGTWKDTDPTL
jgi:glutathione reductase (NADPH)